MHRNGSQSSGFVRAAGILLTVAVIGGCSSTPSSNSASTSAATTSAATTGAAVGSSTEPTGSTLPAEAVIGLDRVQQAFPELTKVGANGADGTAIDNPAASRAVAFVDESGEKKVTISVGLYASPQAAKDAWAIAVKASEDAPGGKAGTPPQLGEEAFAGTSQVGDAMHYGLGFRDGRLIIAATYAGLPVTTENSDNLIALAGEELAAAKQALGAEATG